MTKVVVIGSGGREHALVRALRRGGGNREIVAIPGNPGIAREARCMPAQPSLADAALAESPDLVVVGPEAPLAEGFADRMAQRGVPCFGPIQAAARIESSKAFAKDVMRAAGVLTPRAELFEDPAAAPQPARRPGGAGVRGGEVAGARRAGGGQVRDRGGRWRRGGGGRRRAVEAGLEAADRGAADRPRDLDHRPL